MTPRWCRISSHDAPGYRKTFHGSAEPTKKNKGLRCFCWRPRPQGLLNAQPIAYKKGRDSWSLKVHWKKMGTIEWVFYQDAQLTRDYWGLGFRVCIIIRVELPRTWYSFGCQKQTQNKLKRPRRAWNTRNWEQLYYPQIWAQMMHYSSQHPCSLEPW